jgi:microcystin degradation protein MlrC
MPTTPQTLAIARLWYEASSFTPVLTPLARFREREWVEGDAAPDFYRETRTELGAAVDFLAEHAGRWRARWLRCCAASPGGPVVEQDLQVIIGEITAGIAATGPDAVYLSLHGALIGSGTPCADLEIVRAVRRIIGAKPLVVTFDLHANVPEALAAHVDILVGYKTHPHVDMYETAKKALTLLDAQAAGRIRPVVAVRKVGAILPSFNMRTDAGPMAEIEGLAAEAAAGMPGVLDITAFGGFAYADTPCAGASVTAVADGDRAQAERAVDRIAQEMRSRSRAFAVALPGGAGAVRLALARLIANESARPVAILEPSDNPLSGGAGDTPGLLRALVDRAPDVHAVFAFFWDPGLVERCHALGTGAHLTARFGGRLTPLYGDPVELTVTVERLTDGRFLNRGPMEAGLEVNLGRTAVLRHEALRVIVTEACHAPNDAAYFELHGIALDQVGLLAVKAKNHFRAAFTALTETIVDADTPGPAMMDLSRLPFRNLPPELYAGIGMKGPAPPTPA